MQQKRGRMGVLPCRAAATGLSNQSRVRRQQIVYPMRHPKCRWESIRTRYSAPSRLAARRVARWSLGTPAESLEAHSGSCDCDLLLPSPTSEFPSEVGWTKVRIALEHMVVPMPAYQGQLRHVEAHLGEPGDGFVA